jgi:cell division protein FtsL
VPTRKKRQGLISLPKVVTVITCTVVAILTIDFGRKALDNYQVQQQVDWLEEQVRIEQQTNEDLQQELEHVSSDAYVEEIARERLKLVKPGEVAVVVVPEPGEASGSAAGGSQTEASEAEDLPYWQQWANLLLGSEP